MPLTEYQLSTYLRHIRTIHHCLLEQKHTIFRSHRFSKQQKHILAHIIRRLDKKAELFEHKVLRHLDRYRRFLFESENTEQDEKLEDEKLDTIHLPPITQVVPVGSIYYSSWGYDQTNVEFYQVVGHTGKKTVLLKKIGAKTISEKGGAYEFVVPNPDNFIEDKIYKARIVKYNASPEHIRKLVAKNVLPNLKLSGKNASYNYIYPYDKGDKGLYTSLTH